MAGTTDGPKRPRKPTAGSRTPTSRPRTVAGRGAKPSEVPEPTVSAPVELDKPAAAPPPSPSSPSSSSIPTPVPAARDPRPITAALVAVIVALLALGGFELRYLVSDDTSVPSSRISTDKPVLLAPVTVDSVVDQAAKAADTILSASYRNFDAQVDKATSIMTTTFAKQYRTTKGEIEKRFVQQQTAVVVDVSAQGVVTASPTEVVALLFLTESTTKGGRGLEVSQYRVRVSMLRTGDTWLVSKLETL